MRRKIPHETWIATDRMRTGGFAPWPRPISLKNDAKPRYTFAPLPNDSAYEKHALQNYAKRFVSIRSQKLYPVELQAQISKNPKAQVPNPKSQSSEFGA